MFVSKYTIYVSKLYMYIKSVWTHSQKKISTHIILLLGFRAFQKQQRPEKILVSSKNIVLNRSFHWAEPLPTEQHLFRPQPLWERNLRLSQNGLFP